MAYEIPEFSVSLEAATTLTQFTCVKVDANGKADVAGYGARASGVVVNKASTTTIAQVQAYGIAKVVAGQILTAGDAIISSTTGQAMPYQTTGQFVIGVALASASTTGRVVSVLLQR